MASSGPVFRMIGAVGMVMAIAGCADRVTAPAKPPIFIISIDTLRSDRLPAYGYRGVRTPFIDALVKDSVLYRSAWTHCPLTLPAHASMLTGLLPAAHGVRDNVGFRVAQDVPTIAERLKSSGYATGAAISAFVLRRETGLNRGFDFYDDEVEPLGPSQVIGRVQRDGSDTVRSATTWLAAQTHAPFFFLHIYEPHTPYTPPEPFRSQYRDPYDGEIARSDQIVGEFLQFLKAKNLYDDALIIVTSDHGEGLNDHGEEEHGIFLYREALQVPLIVKYPGGERAGQRVDAPAQLIDLVPTIVETARLQPIANVTGTSLARVDSNAPPRPVYSETYYPRFHFGWSDLHSIVVGNDHYIRAPRPELYDLATDPLEKKNVLEENRRVYFALRNAIEPFVRKAEAPAAIDPEEARKLAALGYLGSSVTTRPGEVLPDPKDTIDDFYKIRVAFTHFRDNRHSEALALIDSLLKGNPRMVDLWDLKSKVLTKLGRIDEAIEAAKSGLRHHPTAPALALTVANLSITSGDLEQAEKHAELALTTDAANAHETLARIWIHRNELDKAEREAKLALEKASDKTTARIALGLIAKQRGDLKASLRYFDEALDGIRTKRHRRVPNLHLYRGDVLARLGRRVEAEKEFRAEIAAYPAEPDAYSNLILLLSEQGRLDEATKLIYDLVAAAPNPPSYVTIAETLKAIGDERGALYWARQGSRKFPNHQALRRLAEGRQRA